MSDREKSITSYLDSVESQHRTKSRFIASLRTLLELVDHGTEVAEDMPLSFYVQNAVGTQLDVLGDIVGADRRFPPVTIPGYPETLNDDLFRYVLLAKIVQNSWDGTNKNFKEIWDATMSGKVDASYYDNQDMSMDVKITSPIEPLMVELLLHGYIVPKPLGVRMNINAILGMEDDSSRAIGVATLDDACVGIKMDYLPDRDTSAVMGISADACANSGYSRCDMSYTVHSESFLLGGCGATMFAGTVHVVCTMYYPKHSSMNEIGYSGIRCIANSARITIQAK